MPKLTADNMRDYYDFVAAKEGGPITVLIGKKKSTDSDPTHPNAIVFKQGLGAGKDRDASLMLQGKAAGFLPVIVAGNDFFIREAYPDKIATKWSEVRGQARELIAQAMDLSLTMLDAGVIDRDRSIVKGSGDNLVARNLVISDKLYFFDFEPEHFINWSKKLTGEDLEGLELWKTTHENLIKGLAINLGLEAHVELLLTRFRGAAEKILASKGEQALKMWHELLRPAKEAESEYQPPTLTVSSMGKSTMHVSPSIPTVKANTPAPTVDTLFAMMKEFYTASNKSAFFAPSKEATIDKMARVTHIVNNKYGSSYDALEGMISKDPDPIFRKVAQSLLDDTRLYLNKAYTTQLHDKDELGARPKGPWGPHNS